jgi:hypothetical protein
MLSLGRQPQGPGPKKSHEPRRGDRSKDLMNTPGRGWNRFPSEQANDAWQSVKVAVFRC